jgi:cobalt transporter subunit CbtA
MIRNLLLAAIAAGMLAGVVATAAQAVRVIPLILEAETYETAEAPAASPTTHDAAAPAHVHDGEAWAPEDGLERLVYTLLSNIITGVGFACVLGAAIMFSNRQVSLKTGAVWGAAGFLVFSLAPALGLPPELPGTEAAELTVRQGWWLLTVVSTAAGLAFIAFPRRVWFKALGVALMVLPHVIGAPHPETHGGLAPGALAAEFAVASLVTAAVFWVVLGSTLGGFLERLGRTA